MSRFQISRGITEPDWRYKSLAGIYGAENRVAMLGYNEDIDTATAPEDVWAGSLLGTLNGINHKLIPLPTAAVSMEVVSDSANDTAAGTGARTVLVNYLDTDFVAKSATITMNGTTGVAMPEAVRRRNGMVILTTGTNPRGTNAGNISLRATGGAGATYGYIRAGAGFEQSSLYTVPAGRTLDVLDVLVSVHQVDTTFRSATFAFSQHNALTGRWFKGLLFAATSTVNYVHHSHGAPILTSLEKTDFWISCENVNSNNTVVTAAFQGILR